MAEGDGREIAGAPKPAARLDEVPIPPSSLAARAFAVTHHGDAFRIALPPGAPGGVDALTTLLVNAESPSWIRGLVWLRNRAVRFVGLQSTTRERPRTGGARYAPGDYAGMFRVFDRTEHEILMGLDDKHLNFRASVLSESDGCGSKSAVLATVVHYNSRLGRLYFFFVRPFHKRIVSAMLRQMARDAGR
jgi:hypothetical protein